MSTSAIVAYVAAAVGDDTGLAVHDFAADDD